MAIFSKRAKVFGIGAAIALAELMTTTAPVWASEHFPINGPEDTARCGEFGGQTLDFGDEDEGHSVCLIDMTADEYCDQTYAAGSKFENDGCGNSNNTDSDCFVTTACAGLIGLDDDCFELRTLRRFRDRVLVGLPGGAADIARYYREAPAIVAAIHAGPSPAAELSRLYARYILPSALLAKLGFAKRAHRTYRAMMADVARRYGNA